ncbi:hypothetical protein ACP275_09G087400 [Erythranthe tilingii]
MGSTRCAFLISTAIILVLIQRSSSAPDATTQALINNICGQTDNFKDCQRSFYGDLYSDTMDAKGLTQVALALTLESASDTRIYLQKAQSDEKRQDVKNLYRICITQYLSLISNFENASLAFAEEEYKLMISDIEPCERFVNSCQLVMGTKVADLGAKNLHTKVLVRMSLISGRLIGSS